jgi:hypothetical protein
MKMKPIWIKRLVSFVVPCATLVLGARQASALTNPVAEVYLENETPWPFLLTNGTVNGLFGFAGTWKPTPRGTDPCQARPDGGPPGIAPPNWMQVSFGATAVVTMAGSVTVWALDVTGSQPTSTMIGTLQWSMDSEASYCPVTWQPIASSFASPLFSASYTSYNAGPGNCVFNINLKGGPALQTARRPQSLTAGQAISSPNYLSSADGSTSLEFQVDSSGACSLFGEDSAYNRTLIASGTVMAIMDGNSNFAAYDIWGNQVWSTGTASGPGAWLQVDAGMLRVLRPWTFKGQRYIKTLWQMNVP